MAYPWIAYFPIRNLGIEAEQLLSKVTPLIRGCKFHAAESEAKRYSEGNSYGSEVAALAHYVFGECWLRDPLVDCPDKVVGEMKRCRSKSANAELVLATYFIECFSRRQSGNEKLCLNRLAEAVEYGEPYRTTSLRWAVLANMLAEMYGKARRFEEAIKSYDKVISSGTIHSDEVISAKNGKIACLALGEGRGSPAFRSLLDEVLADPACHRLHCELQLQRGLSHYLDRNYESAIAEFTDVIVAQQHNGGYAWDHALYCAYIGRGECMEELGELEFAQADLSRARRLRIELIQEIDDRIKM